MKPGAAKRRFCCPPRRRSTPKVRPAASCDETGRTGRNPGSKARGHPRSTFNAPHTAFSFTRDICIYTSASRRLRAVPATRLRVPDNTTNANPPPRQRLNQMTALTVDLAKILQTVRRPGDFQVAGTSEVFAPQIEVAGVGAISLPLLPAQAEQLAAVAEQAPYGRGTETLIDTAVRRTWQIGPDRMRIGGRHWAQSLAAIVARCAAGLGVSEPVSAELYKMLVYDTGSFFVSHRDTEKAAGMFATLAIVLPSIYTGGELVIRHRDREVCLDLACEDRAEVGFAAFYADCQHEVRPVTSGCRLVLIYNLIRHGPGRLPEPPAYDAEQEQVEQLLGRWASDASAAAPESDSSRTLLDKLIYPLEHSYTPAEVGFARLKNADAATATVLVATARRAGCELYLALLTIAESGSAEVEYSSRSSRYRAYADSQGTYADQFEVGEVIERSLKLSDWQAPDGSRPPLATLPFKDEELSPPDALQDEEPDEQMFTEATGNEGASFERSYRRAAFVLWPQARKRQVIVGGGLDVALPYLAGLAQRWLAGTEKTGSAVWNEAHQLALTITNGSDWSKHRWRPGAGPTQAATMLASLSQLRDSEGIASFLIRVTADGHYADGDNDAIAEATRLLPPEQTAELLERIVARNTTCHAAACAELLERVCSRFSAVSSCESSIAPIRNASSALLEPAAMALLAALPGDPQLAPKPEVWPRPTPVTPALVASLLTALCRVQSLVLGERAADHLLAWPQTFAFDEVLVPAALQLGENSGATAGWPPTLRLKGACLAHLEKRIAEPLAPPADFARTSHISCACKHCAELAAFLADRARSLWVFKAAQAHRQHVENSIRQHGCDLDLETQRHGSPHALLCTKNQASYERRLARRKKDLEQRACLAGASPAS